MTQITIHGKLGETLGRSVWNLAVSSPAEAIRALEANTGRLYQYLLAKANEGIRYRVVTNGNDFGSEEELRLNRPCETIDIIPVMEGAGQGLWQTIIGGALVVIGAVMSFFPVTSWLAPAVIGMGLSMMCGGIAQMLTKTNSANTNNPRKPSYLFGGVLNNTTQGDAVPLGYGKMLIGSQVISSSVSFWILPFGGATEIVAADTAITDSLDTQSDVQTGLMSASGYNRPAWMSLQTLVS